MSRNSRITSPADPTRRRFLIAGAAVSGGLLVGCGAPTPQERLGQAGQLPVQGGQVALNGWVKIAPDGVVTVAVPRAEMGQGVMTALPMLLADELDARWEDVRAEVAPVDQIYANQAMMLNALPFGVDDQGWVARMGSSLAQRAGHALHLQVTGGSSSIRDAWLPLRVAGSTARALLVQAAAARWQVPASDCRTQAGRVLHAGSGRSLGYGELVAEAAKLSPPSEVPLKDPAQFTLIGRSAPRQDVPAKVDGSAVFGIDVRVPDMVHAALIQAPVFGADVASFDGAQALRRRGVRQVLRIPHAVAVIADSGWRARQACADVQVSWTPTPHDRVSSADIARDADQALKTASGTGFVDRGDAAQALAEAARPGSGGRVIEARYHAPYLAHAALEPINCIAQVRDGRVNLWVPTQSASLARWRAAQVAGVDTEHVTLHQPLLGGGFGRRLEIDMVEQAVQLALQTEGRPVKLVWSREDDTRHDFYRPAAWADFRAALDAKGQLLAWHNRVAAQAPSNQATARLLPWAAADSPDKSQIEGAFDLPYDIAHLHVEQVRLTGHVPVGFWRSVGHSYNAFFTECFADEVAHAAGVDPLARRARSGLGPGLAGRARARHRLAGVVRLHLRAGGRGVGGRGARARAPRGLRHRLRRGGQPRHGGRADGGQHRLRAQRRAAWRDHAGARPRAASQLPRLRHGSPGTSAAHRGAHPAQRPPARWRGRARRAAPGARGGQRLVCPHGPARAQLADPAERGPRSPQGRRGLTPHAAPRPHPRGHPGPHPGPHRLAGDGRGPGLALRFGQTPGAPARWPQPA